MISLTLALVGVAALLLALLAKRQQRPVARPAEPIPMPSSELTEDCLHAILMDIQLDTLLLEEKDPVRDLTKDPN